MLRLTSRAPEIRTLELLLLRVARCGSLVALRRSTGPRNRPLTRGAATLATGTRTDGASAQGRTACRRRRSTKPRPKPSFGGTRSMRGSGTRAHGLPSSHVAGAIDQRTKGKNAP